MPTCSSKRRRFLAACLGAAATGTLTRTTSADQSEGPVIDADFPGGNILVDRIDGDDVYLHQDPRDTPGFWFYWSFRVRQASSRKLTFHFTSGNVLASRGPAVSVDGGKTWQWLGAESMEGPSFVYTFPDGTDGADVRFCLAIPYQEADLRAFLRRHHANDAVRVEPHSVSRKGRNTPRIRLGRIDGDATHRVLLTGRHHCCEMMASWALEGLMDEVLSETDDGRWLCRQVEFLVVPLMDHDGVEDGDQGKNRNPHDHNRDYLGKSIYPSVAALREFLPNWSQGRLRAAIDLHCPYIRGGGDGPSSNERVFFVGGPSEAVWAETGRLSTILEKIQTGPLVHHPRNNIPWGQSWNTLAEPRSCARWAAAELDVALATTMEIPYANVADTLVTVESARLLGRDLARAIRRYLETL